MKRRLYFIMQAIAFVGIAALWSCDSYDDVQEGNTDYFSRSKTFAETIDGQTFWFIPEADGSKNVLVTWNRLECNSIIDYVKMSAKYSGIVDVPQQVTHNGVTYTVTGADDNAFYHCGDITALRLQEGMTRWGEHTWFCSPFRSVMKKVTEVYLPSSLTDMQVLPDYYFMNNAALVTCHIPDVTEIGDSAFFKCSKMTTVNIPETVVKIGKGAFANCSAMTELTLPASVELIGEDCFLSAKKLTKLHVKAAVPPTMENAWALANKCSLYVPTGSKGSYEADELWSKFKTITEE